MGISPRLLRPKATGLDPRSIPGLVLWLDAADGSTLFQDSAATTPASATNDPVGAWLDKSGNGRHMLQPSSSPRPVRSTQNNRSSLSFNGSTAWMRQERTNYRMRTQFLVWRRTGTPNLFASPFGANGSIDSAIGGSANYASSDAFSLTYYQAATAGNHYWASNTASLQSTAFRSLGVSANVANVNLYTSGVYAATNTTDVAVVSAVFANASATNKAFFAGLEPYGPSSPLRWYPCNLCEVLQYDGALSESQIAAVERYLATKWGAAMAPQVANADAQNWINRVYLAGGQVTPSCASAVDAFCTAIEDAGIRSKFYRLNLFCGTGLTSCLVPLYRGPSLGGTQYGSATDVNSGGLFVSADYTETGSAAGGLKGSSNKYLDTGFDYTVLPSVASRHIAVYETLKSPNTFDASIGHSANSSVDGFVLGTFAASSDYALWRAGGFGGQGAVLASSSGYSNGGFWIGQNTSLRATQLYKNGIQSATGSADSDMAALGGTVAVFAWKITGGVPDPTLVYYSAARLGGYSIGTSFTAGEALAYHNAMQSFQTALSRNAQ